MNRVERLANQFTSQDGPTASTPKEVVSMLRSSFETRKTFPLEWRRAQLEGMIQLLQENSEKFAQAMHEDLGRSEFQTLTLEFSAVIPECRDMIKNLSSWAEPVSTSVPLFHFPGSGKIVPEPLGVALIIGAWNFPIAVSLSPFIGAIAAGNCAVLKPSELAGKTSNLFAELFPKYLDPECFAVVEGGPEETTELLAQSFDHIFFTGSERVGRIVYQAAAKNMTPTTLELGGKSPVVVDETANLQVTARRVLWAKFLNCGQICTSPDYVLVLRSQKAGLIEALKQTYAEFFPNGPKECEDYSRIINDRNVDRLLHLIDQDETIRGKIVLGGDFDRKMRYIGPTVLVDTSPDSKLMEEEIFGPYLPIMTVDSLDEAFTFISKRNKPLAAYIFTSSQPSVDEMVSRVSAGGIVVNDVVIHYGVTSLPFGGVGSSGMGVYRGKHSFDTFSHFKPVLHKSGKSFLDPNMRYPPYSEKDKYWTKKFI